VAARLETKRVRAGVVNARFIKPLDADLLAAHASEARGIVTLENGAVAGGFGSAVREALATLEKTVPVLSCGWPDAFVGQGTTLQLMADAGITPERLTDEIYRLFPIS